MSQNLLVMESFSMNICYKPRASLEFFLTLSFTCANEEHKVCTPCIYKRPLISGPWGCSWFCDYYPKLFYLRQKVIIRGHCWYPLERYLWPTLNGIISALLSNAGSYLSTVPSHRTLLTVNMLRRKWWWKIPMFRSRRKIHLNFSIQK